MSNILYPKAKEGMLSGSFNLSTDTVKATLIDTEDYTYSASHQYMNTDTVPAAAKISTVTLSSKTITNGVFDAGDSRFYAATGDPAEAIIIWKDGGDSGESASGTNDLLIAYLDSATGLPVTPNGGDIELAWDSGASRIFAL